jgi:hypothetical protein
MSVLVVTKQSKRRLGLGKLLAAAIVSAVLVGVSVTPAHADTDDDYVKKCIESSSAFGPQDALNTDPDHPGSYPSMDWNEMSADPLPCQFGTEYMKPVFDEWMYYLQQGNQYAHLAYDFALVEPLRMYYQSKLKETVISMVVWGTTPTIAARPGARQGVDEILNEFKNRDVSEADLANVAAILAWHLSYTGAKKHYVKDTIDTFKLLNDHIPDGNGKLIKNKAAKKGIKLMKNFLKLSSTSFTAGYATLIENSGPLANAVVDQTASEGLLHNLGQAALNG